MPPTSRTMKSGQPKLSEPPRLSDIARKVVAPAGAVTTGWPAVRKTCNEKMGITFDPWQEQVGGLILAKRADGTLAAMIDGLTSRCPVKSARHTSSAHSCLGYV